MTTLSPSFTKYIASDDHPFIELRKLFNLVRQINGEGFIPINEHVFIHDLIPGWIFKKKREDGYQYCEDQHLYRVRKAHKISNFINYKDYRSIEVAEKYLIKINEEWWVAAKKMRLSTRSLEIDPDMANEAANIIFDVNLVDIHLQNFAFTEYGKLALFDTEPVNRKMKKDRWHFIPLLNDKPLYKYETSFNSCESLKTLCSSNTSRVEIEKVQNEQYWVFAAKKVKILALSILLICTCYYLLDSLPNLRHITVALGVVYTTMVFLRSVYDLSMVHNLYKKTKKI